MKIDGARETILRNKPVMIVEVFPDNVVTMTQAMKNLDYVFVSAGGYEYIGVSRSSGCILKGENDMF